MARIQVLELPMVEVDGVMTTPFSIVIDNLDTVEMLTSTGISFLSINGGPTQAQADQIAREMGAVSAIIYAATLDLA